MANIKVIFQIPYLKFYKTKVIHFFSLFYQQIIHNINSKFKYLTSDIAFGIIKGRDQNVTDECPESFV
jgi:hypothetical protein